MSLTPGAWAALHKLAEKVSATADHAATQLLKQSAQILGLLEMTESEWTGLPADIVRQIEALIEARRVARSERNFGKSDLIRHGLSDAGVKLSDSIGGTTWSIVADEIDSGPYFRSVRAAFMSDDSQGLTAALLQANEAGFTFANTAQLDTSPIWRGNPSPTHTSSVVNRLYSHFVESANV
jgi:hypothetical protein